MSAPKGNVDVFGSYLSRVGAASKASPFESAEAGAEISVLRMLKASEEPVSVKTLMTQLEIPPSVLMRTIALLSEAKLVVTSADDHDEKVELTGLGRNLAE